MGENLITMLEKMILLNSGKRDDALETWLQILQRCHAIGEKIKGKPSETTYEAAMVLRDLMTLHQEVLKLIVEENEKEIKIAECLSPENLARIDKATWPDVETNFEDLWSQRSSRHLHILPNLILNFVKHASQVVPITIDKDVYAALNDLGFTILLTSVQYFVEHEYSTPSAMQDFSSLATEVIKKQTTAKARVKKQAKSEADHQKILEAYKELKRKNPALSKNAASLLIGDGAKINLTPQVIRRHLNKV